MADVTMPGLPATRDPLVAEPDLLRALVEETVNALFGAEADERCGASYGERSDDRVSRRNGCRERRWETRAGTIDLPPKWGDSSQSAPPACNLGHARYGFSKPPEEAHMRRPSTGTVR